MKRIKKGFTLVEVIIVLAIIAIIAAIAIPSLSKVRLDSMKKADDRSLESIIRIVERLIVDESIEEFVEVKITIDPSGSVTIFPVTAELREVDEYFEGIEKPQTKDMNKYEINIDSIGNITGQTIN